MTAAEHTSGTQSVIITIDGPAGTGKSTVAHRLARRLGLDFLDTGAMYRAAALLAIEEGIDPTDGRTLADQLRQVDLHFDWTSDPPCIHMDHRDVSDRIRQMVVSRQVSIIAAHQPVRQVLIEQQRMIARRHPRLVTEGRDQGSVVFPEAPVRFFLQANVTVRAARRVEQLRAAGQDVDAALVREDIERRDQLDAARKTNPLIVPPGAIVIDTDERTIDEVVDLLEQEVRSLLPDVLLESE